ncbi:unnamed protein product [Ectocarpus sp. 12 AP-2014]
MEVAGSICLGQQGCEGWLFCWFCRPSWGRHHNHRNFLSFIPEVFLLPCSGEQLDKAAPCFFRFPWFTSYPLSDVPLLHFSEYPLTGAAWPLFLLGRGGEVTRGAWSRHLGGWM